MSLIAALFGALVGSFLNVVIFRLPRGISLVKPASACPICQHRIRTYDNIPILSWVALRGKCRDCHSKISARYPLIEALTATLFALIAWRFPVLSFSNALELLALLYLASMSIALAFIDWDTHTLPNRIVLPSYWIGALLIFTSATASGDVYPFIRALIGGAVMWSLYLIMALAYKNGMGFGDVKTAGVLGLFLGYWGWREVVVGTFSAFLLGGCFALALLFARRVDRKTGIPFGPWMLIGAWLGIFLGAAVAQKYLVTFGLAQGI